MVTAALTNANVAKVLNSESHSVTPAIQSAKIIYNHHDVIMFTHCSVCRSVRQGHCSCDFCVRILNHVIFFLDRALGWPDELKTLLFFIFFLKSNPNDPSQAKKKKKRRKTERKTAVMTAYTQSHTRISTINAQMGIFGILLTFLLTLPFMSL